MFNNSLHNINLSLYFTKLLSISWNKLEGAELTFCPFW